MELDIAIHISSTEGITGRAFWSQHFAKLKINRQNEIATVHAGVCAKKQNLHYVSKDAVGGFIEFAAQNFQETWWNESEKANALVVQCKPLRHILAETFGNESPFFDFFRLDVEGAELQVLESINFDEAGFGIIFVESDSTNKMKNLGVRSLLESHGYLFLGNVSTVPMVFQYCVS